MSEASNKTLGAGGDGDAQALTFAYTKPVEPRTPQKADGSAGTPATFARNFATNTAN